ncbi:MAG: glycoside hydrolase family 31 protein [Verrucomicrobiota bacterium]
MYFNKIRHPANFTFAAPASTTLKHLGGDVHRLTVRGRTPWKNPSQAELAARLPGKARHAVTLTPDNGLAVTETATGRVLLAGVPGATHGTCGDAWMLQFRHHEDIRFYGLGEHSGKLEKTGQRVKFWNTDLWGDFSLHEIKTANPNPMYVSIPWLIVKQGNDYLGILVNHPGAVFMDLASSFIWSADNPDDRNRRSFYVGAPDGDAEVYLIVGPSLPELTRKLQKLVGTTPLPPLWALGHHQCRWGYAGPKDLDALDRGFTKNQIPTDGLWLDIDYMDRYKVFTFDPRLWGGEEQIRKSLAKLARNGRRVVPILDPGVKVEPGYIACDDGLKQGVFCLNPAGKPYVGFVWPGQTYLPDYSLPKTRAWWAGYVKKFAELGNGGAWLDMNDPSVGAVELDDMLFQNGKQPHAYYHNQYALGMARASRDGFLAARPDERPFLLARSAFISSSRHTAVWTGDNVANWHHLRGCIPLSVGLALSGHPFNGPDVCGFGDDTTPELAIAWYKTGFLFPFFRNHSMLNSRQQEPWALGPTALKVIGRYIRLRYKLLPYLYNAFIAQEETGEAILRPLFYDYADTPELPLDRISDQFMVGRDILQAPIIDEGATARAVVLPGTHRWFSAQDGRWLDGGQTVEIAARTAETPLFVREGALIPMQVGERSTQKNDLGQIELHCFLHPDTADVATTTYAFDDGLGFGYQKGERTTATFIAKAERDELVVVVDDLVAGYRPLTVQLVIHGKFKRASLVHGGRRAALALKPGRVSLTGKALSVRFTRATTLR